MAAAAAARQPLISGLSDLDCQPQKKNSIKKRRFRRCRTIPSIDVFLDPAKPGGLFPGSKVIFSNFNPSFRQITLLVVIYLALGAGCFYLVRNQIQGKKTNAVLDAVYFVIVTMTTVGYGDLVPSSAGAKLLACAFVFSGMAIVGLFLSKAADYLVEKQEVVLVKALHARHKAGDAQMLREIKVNRVKYKCLMTLVFIVLLMSAGTIFLSIVEKLDLVDAFYCVCSTITTLGYGDKSFSTEGGRAFAVVWILTSTICVAQFFLYLAEVYTESRQHLLAKWVLTRRMTFVDLEAADLDEDGVVG